MSSTQPADVRQPVADLDAALAVLLEADLERIELVALLAVGVVDDDDASQLEPLRVLHVGLNGVSAIVLPAYFVEHRLRVEALHVADAAVHEQPDDALGLRREMRPAIGRRGSAASRCVSIARERDAEQAHGHVAEEITAGVCHLHVSRRPAPRIGVGGTIHGWLAVSRSARANGKPASVRRAMGTVSYLSHRHEIIVIQQRMISCDRTRALCIRQAALRMQLSAIGPSRRAHAVNSPAVGVAASRAVNAASCELAIRHVARLVAQPLGDLARHGSAPAGCSTGRSACCGTMLSRRR